jgi:hypothetical protein
MFVGWYFVVAGLFVGEWVLVAAYLLSIIAATSLDGSHIFVHGYYFIGTCAFSLVLMARVMGGVTDRFHLKTLTFVLIAWGVLFNIRGNVWIWARDSEYWKVDYWRMGAEARKTIGDGFHLVTDDGANPLKLIYMGRSGTNSAAGVYQTCEKPQYQAIPLALISDLPPPPALCGGRKIDRRQLETPFAKWYITIVQ